MLFKSPIALVIILFANFCLFGGVLPPSDTLHARRIHKNVILENSFPVVRSFDQLRIYEKTSATDPIIIPDQVLADSTQYYRLMFPPGYTSPFVQAGQNAMWQGFFLQRLHVRLPPSFSKKNSKDRIIIGVENMILDDQGLAEPSSQKMF